MRCSVCAPPPPPSAAALPNVACSIPCIERRIIRGNQRLDTSDPSDRGGRGGGGGSGPTAAAGTPAAPTPAPAPVDAKAEEKKAEEIAAKEKHILALQQNVSHRALCPALSSLALFSSLSSRYGHASYAVPHATPAQCQRLKAFTSHVTNSQLQLALCARSRRVNPLRHSARFGTSLRPRYCAAIALT